MRLSILLLAPLFVCGCASQNAARNDPIRGVAASVVEARAYDRADLALRRRDEAGFAVARAELERAQDINQSPSQRRNSRLALSDALNRAGYTLAEEGNTNADFDRAIALTSKALGEVDQFIQSLPPNDPSLPNAIFKRASEPRDSHAWALFKRGRLAQARTQQELVLKELGTSGLKQKVQADIPFHMAEIYRALGESDKAREFYEEALKLGPDSVLDGRIRAGLAQL